MKNNQIISESMPLTLPGINSLLDAYDTFIVDLWGVVHDGVVPLKGVIECLSTLKNLEKTVVFLTNAPRRVASVTTQLERIGVPSSLYTFVYSSGESAFEALQQKQPLGPAFLAMAPMHQGLVYDLGLKAVQDISQAAFILNTGPEPLHMADHIPWLEQAAARHIPMVCVNPDIHVISGGALKLCAGSLAKHYESLGGPVSYHGKPYEDVYKSVLAKIPHVDVKRLLVIGDSLETDILGAQTIGFDSGLVLTGVETSAMGSQDSLTFLPALLERIQVKGIKPSYIIDGFRL